MTIEGSNIILPKQDYFKLSNRSKLALMRLTPYGRNIIRKLRNEKFNENAIYEALPEFSTIYYSDQNIVFVVCDEKGQLHNISWAEVLTKFTPELLQMLVETDKKNIIENQTDVI